MYPTGEDWDFILPGTKAEINGENEVDYSIIRKPKIEIVSFRNCSVPLIQIDFGVKLDYSEIAKLFPEGILMPDWNHVWVYLKNPSTIDIACVVRQAEKPDWSGYFKGYRLE